VVVEGEKGYFYHRRIRRISARIMMGENGWYRPAGNVSGNGCQVHQLQTVLQRHPANCQPRSSGCGLIGI
tara:strand:- start:141 stop:350 length:210 start_codon:yes stop_codon:yes gene_type:complete